MTRTALVRTAKQALSKYDPERGLKTIAVTKMAVKEYARVGDVGRVEQAIRAQLDAEAEFVVWWDTKGPGTKHGGKQSRGSGTLRGLPTKQLVHRWRKNLNDPKAFESAYERIRSKTIKSIRFESTVHVNQNSGELEWYTPAAFIEAAREVLSHIDLDPCSTDVANQVVKAEQIFTAQDNGLTQRWDGRVWMNPPYAQPLITQFCEKLAASVRAGTVPAAIVLVNNATETQWFRAVADVAAALCFPAGRISYWYPDRSSVTGLQGQAVLYIGEDVQTFCRVFAPFGFLAVVWR